MNAVTLRVEAGAQKKYNVSLWEGAPGAVGAQMLAEAWPAIFNVKKLQKAVLDKTGSPQEIGEKIGKFLLSGDVAKDWDAKARNPLCTYLDLRVRALDSAPWEFARRDGRTLFLRNTMPFLHHQQAPAREYKPESGIRVLAILAANDLHDEIGGRQEARAIRHALRPVNRVVDLMVVASPQRTDLKKHVEEYRPHVLHIIGHGDRMGLRIFDGKDTFLWGPTEIENDLNSWKWMPELVYLNTCGSGASFQEREQDAQWTVVTTFLQYGCSAVIAMLADVRGRLAVAGAGAFYESLANGDTVDIAITKNRHAIALAAPGNESTSFEPYLPRLTVTRSVETILRHTSQAVSQPCPDLDAALETFVDRELERRRLVSLLEKGTRAVVIQGEPEVGKSWLLQWCMDAWLRRGMEVRYVEIGACRTWLEVLQAIRDGNPRKTGCIHQGLSAEVRARLNWRLNALASGIADPPEESFQEGVEEDRKRTSTLVHPQAAMIDAHIKAMSALQAALHKEAGNGGLVIVLDNFGAGDMGLPGAYFSILREHWIDNLVVRSPSGVRVILGVKSSHLREYGLQTLPDGFKKVDLDYFPSTEFENLMLELLPLRYREELGEKREKALKWLSKELPDLDPADDKRPLNGVVLMDHCQTIWDYCKLKKKVWEKET